MNRSSFPELFLVKGVLKTYTKVTVDHSCRSAILTLQSSFIKITLWHGCSPVKLLHIFRTSFLWIPLNGCFMKTPMHSKTYREYCYLEPTERISIIAQNIDRLDLGEVHMRPKIKSTRNEISINHEKNSVCMTFHYGRRNEAKFVSGLARDKRPIK